MAHYFLSITLPDYKTFDSYYYGAGVEVFANLLQNGKVSFLVDYGNNEFLAHYQNERFGSGLYFGKVLEEQ